MLPTTTDMMYFLAVAETLNIRRAAERLRIAQPSLSIALRRLEDALGVSLLIRFKTGVQLTRAGERFVKKAHALVEEWEKVRTEAVKDEVEVKGRYVIGSPLDLQLIALPKSLAKLLRSHPNLQIELADETPVRVSEDVVNFKIDFGIVPNPLRHPDLVIRRICTDEIRLWVSNSRQPTQDPQSGQAVLVYDPAVVWWFAGTERKITFAHNVTTTSFAMVARLVAAGVGIGVLPTGVAERLSTTELRPLPRDLLSLPHEICFIYRSDAQRSPASRQLAREMEAAVREAMSRGGAKTTA
jgi:DNA-binding transcriptional LysR family regulator